MTKVAKSAQVEVGEVEVTVQTGETIAGRFIVANPVDDSIPGMSTFTGHDTRLDQGVTIHLIDSVAPSAVVRAAHRARLVSDPRLVRVLAAHTHGRGADRRTYVVTDQPRGARLDTLLTRAALAPSAAAAVVGSLAAALLRAKSSGVRHGHIRTRDVTITDGGHVVLTGLGIVGELVSQSGAGPTPREKDDAVALARLFVTAVTARAVDEVTVAHLPDDLPEAARALSEGVLAGKGPRTVAEVIAALGTGNYAALRELAREAPRLWWPAAPTEALPESAEPAPEPEPTALEPEHEPAETAPEPETEPETEPEPNEPAPARPLTRFGHAVDDLDEFHDIIADQNQVIRPSVVEAIATRLHHRFPGSARLTRAAQAAHRRAQAPAPIRPAPLLVAVMIVAIFVACVIAIDKIQTPLEPATDGPSGDNYPQYSFGATAPAPAPLP